MNKLIKEFSMHGIKKTELDRTHLLDTENTMLSWDKNSGSLIEHFPSATVPTLHPKASEIQSLVQKKRKSIFAFSET